MAKKDKNKELNHEFNAQDAREALDRVEAKLAHLSDVVENRLAEERGPQRAAPIMRSKVVPVEMPSDIEIDTNDKYNTQPKNSSLHHYGKNHRMFRKDAFRNVMKSKMFWILLVILPIIFTFVEFIFIGWGVMNNFIFTSGLTKISADLINWFMIMPLLLLSLTVFPTFIAMSRENNQLKRYAMKGMSRKQIYWSYIRFSTLFLMVFIFIWMGPWIKILNMAADNIWLTDEQLAAGEHVFSNPWGVFFGMDYNSIQFKNSINVIDLTLMWNSNALENPDAGLAVVTVNDTINFLTDNMTSEAGLANIETAYEQMTGFAMSFNDPKAALEVFALLDADSMDNLGNVEFSERIALVVAATHEGIQALSFFVLFILLIFGVNSVGFNKAMKVTSSRSLLGWGIGLWIFSAVVQGTTSLVYKDIYKFNSIDKVVWNTVVMILLFVLKWMFIFSPITTMMVGISLTAGYIEQPELNPYLEQINNFMDSYDPATAGLVVQAIYERLTLMDIYDPLINPQLTKEIFVGLSALCAIYWTVKTWMFKSQIVSYEASR